MGDLKRNISSAKKPIAFLDRDGVLILDHGYVYRPEDVEWSPDAFEALRWLKDQGFLVVIVTNQSGIGRGMYTEEQFRDLMRWMKDALGDLLDAYYFCPHLPEDDCDCRKPKPGMLLQALQELKGDPKKSFMLGDMPSDLQAGEAAGVKSFLYEGGSLLTAVQTLKIG